jgi:carbon-monoxide dehydrogenase large subunit
MPKRFSPVKEGSRMSIMGGNNLRFEGIQKVSGSYTYLPDISLPGMIFGKLRRSELPHAKIVHIDTAKAKKIRGVVAVLTGADLPYKFGFTIRDEPFLARERVRYIGEPVAAVSALSPEIAAEAAGKIVVEYQEVDPVFNSAEAMQDGASLVHPNLHEYFIEPLYLAKPHTNIHSFVKIEKGHIEKGFDDSDEIFEDIYSTPAVAHCPLETHAAIAQVDLSGKITVWSSSQGPYLVRRDLAIALGLPFNKVRVIVSGLGGAFGGKSFTKIEPVTVGLALHSSNRPVKLVLTREEEFELSPHKIPTRIYIKTGVSKKGVLLARYVKTIFDSGAYADCSPLVVRNACFSAAGPYNIDHVLIEGYCVYTNNLVSGAFRGFGTPQLTWAYESQMDVIAHKLGIDPLEIRLKNCVLEGHETPSGEILKGVGVKETLEKAAKEIGWGNLKTRKDYGIGIACCHKLSSSPATSSANVKMDEDGTVQIDCATVEMGQGSNTALIQIASEILGIPFERIGIISPDTDHSPYDLLTAASRSTFNMGNAIIMACEDLKKQLLNIASSYYEVAEDKLDIHEGKIRQRGSDESGLTYVELLQWRFKPRRPSLIGRGMYTSKTVLPDVKTGKTPKASAFWMYGTQIVLLRVDRSTGQVEVKKVVSAYDVGKAIYPHGIEGQIEGGVIQGLGSVLTEELKIDEGKVLNSSYRDYHLLTIMDTPEIIPIIVETIHDDGPFGAKGIGELVLNPTAPAVANAIYDAVGVRICDLPLEQEKIFNEISRKSNSFERKKNDR